MYHVHDDYHCVSSISIDEDDLRDDCAKFSWKIRTWVHFHPKGKTWGAQGRVFQCEDWATEQMRSDFKTKFAQTINKGFGDGAIWLCHTQRGTKDLWVDIEIKYVPYDERRTAQLCVNAVTGPGGTPTVLTDPPGNGPFRGWCQSLKGDRRYTPDLDPDDQDSEAPELNVWGNVIDMHMTYDAVVNAPTTQNCTDDTNTAYSTQQYILLHEFGHYVGLDHPCAGQTNGYCHTHSRKHLDNLMAAGSKFYPEHTEHIKNRLKEHHRDYVRKAHRVYPFLAKGHTAAGGGDRQNRPWKNDPKWAVFIEDMMRARAAQELEDESKSWWHRE